MQDTIVAIATPPGRGGIGVIRISGPHVKSIAEKIVGHVPKPRQAEYLPFYDFNKQVLDRGLALFFPNPHSFTGEDVLELQGHGGPVILDLLVHAIVEAGARLAKPGEFSERAFLNDKLDLTQAEAISDLINATSEQAARSAMRSLEGEFSKQINDLVEMLIYLRMYVEAAIDFPEEEIDFLADTQIQEQLKKTQVAFDALLASAQQGRLLQEGMTVVIAGKPNAGKSSLLNALTGRESAIVTAIPGTTRDVLKEYIHIDGMPLHIIDTAGIRESDDPVEQEGIRRAKQAMEKADCILVMIDSNESQKEDTHEMLLQFMPENIKMIIVRNKIDINHIQPGVEEKKDKTVINLSAKTGLGLNLLKEHLKALMGYTGNTEGLFIARRRHLTALNKAKQHLEKGIQELRDNRAGELLAEELKLAQQALGEITGEFRADDLLGRIFSSFCIGK